jgi:hypothetical protein
VFLLGSVEKQSANMVPRTQLDQFVPVYQFREYHSTSIRAQAEEIFDAIKSVTADDIFLFRGLTWIRRLGRRGPASILNPPANQPILDVATKTSFVLLANQPNREIVVGIVVIAPRRWRLRQRPTPQEFKSLRAPGFALAAMNFLIERESAAEHVLSTETRIFATSASARLRFAAYWTAIYPGSALLRRMWLRAIAVRAQRETPAVASRQSSA